MMTCPSQTISFVRWCFIGSSRENLMLKSTGAIRDRCYLLVYKDAINVSKDLLSSVIVKRHFNLMCGILADLYKCLLSSFGFLHRWWTTDSNSFFKCPQLSVDHKKLSHVM